MAENEIETVAQYARRKAAEYVEQFHPNWASKGKKWLKYAFANGYKQACIDHANEADAIDRAVVAWEQDGDAEALATAVDAWLERIFARAPEEAEVAA